MSSNKMPFNLSLYPTLAFSEASHKMFYSFFSVAAFPFLPSSLAPPSQQILMSPLDQLCHCSFASQSKFPLSATCSFVFGFVSFSFSSYLFDPSHTGWSK